MKFWIGIVIGIFLGTIVAGIFLNSQWENLLEDCQSNRLDIQNEMVVLLDECNSRSEGNTDKCEVLLGENIGDCGGRIDSRDEYLDSCYDTLDSCHALVDDWEEIYYNLLNDCYPTKDSYPICSYNAYDCKDFQTWPEAQTVMEFCGNNDIHWLDGDGDGIACEELK